MLIRACASLPYKLALLQVASTQSTNTNLSQATARRGLLLRVCSEKPVKISPLTLPTTQQLVQTGCTQRAHFNLALSLQPLGGRTTGFDRMSFQLSNTPQYGEVSQLKEELLRLFMTWGSA